MSLTTAQYTTLKADIAANANTVLINGVPTAISAVPVSPDNAAAVAVWYGGLVDPEYLVWKGSVTWDEIMQNGMDWTRVDNLSVGKARIWEWMFDNTSRTFNPSKPNIRAGIDAVWVGTAADLAVRDSVYGHCRRACTRVERLFVAATPNGSGTRGSTANPDTLGYEGALDGSDVLAAWAA